MAETRGSVKSKQTITNTIQLMKKVFTLIAALLAGSAVSSAQVFIGTTEYESINAAADAAAEGDVIEVRSDVSVSNRVNFDKVDNVTLQAVEGVTISCRTKNKLAFLVKKPTTLKNLTLVYNDDASNQPLIEASSGSGKLNMENCSMSNFSGTNNQGLISIKSSGSAVLTNVTFSNNVLPEGRGEVFIGNTGSTVDGTTNASIFIEKNLSVAAGENFNPSSPCRLFIDDARTLGSTLVTGTEDVAKFNLMSDKYSLKAQDGNIVTGEFVAGEGAVTIGQLGFGNLTDALAAAKDGDIITINEDITISNTVNFKDVNSLTLTAKDGVTISCLVKNKLAFLVNNSATLKNLKMTYTEQDESTATLIEVSSPGSKLTMENCEINDFNGTNKQGIISVKNNGNITLNNVTAENCTVADGCGELFLGGSGSAINGTTDLSIFLEKDYNVTAGAEFAPAKTVKLFVDENRTMGSVIVAGTEDATKFELQGTAFSLEAKDGNLVAGEYQGGSGIAGIAADENAPVEYYNLNGMQVSAGNMTPGVYVRRQGNTAVKVLVK